MRSEDHGWDADDALFRPRPPILSHRRPRPTRRGAWLTATVLALGVATLTGGTLSLHTGTGPDQAHNPPAPLTRYPPTAQVSAPDAGSGPASPATSSQPSSRRPAPGPTTDPDAATPRPAAPPTRPAAPPTTNQPTPAGPTPAPTTAGPPSPALMAPANGLTVLLTNQASGQYAGVAQAATWDGARITQSTSTGAGQQWRLVTA
ncbi:MAG TPA: hypothetical protein VHA75_03885, partial [Rugosimonospora sp.]|nr:hypothetical protein [Rugosimonospora sp.]